MFLEFYNFLFIMSFIMRWILLQLLSSVSMFANKFSGDNVVFTSISVVVLTLFHLGHLIMCSGVSSSPQSPEVAGVAVGFADFVQVTIESFVAGE